MSESEREPQPTLAEIMVRAEVEQQMYLHLQALAQICADGNRGNSPRWRAALDVRDYCATRARQKWAEAKQEIEEYILSPVGEING